MKDILLMYAEYTKRANADALALVGGLSAAARDAERGSYYGSLAGLVRHLAGGTLYFHGLCRAALPKSFPATAGLSLGEGWDGLPAACAAADSATVDFVRGASDADLVARVPLDWYGGDPPDVPLHFLLHQLFVHGIHHRGQISQILDELKVEHDYSGIDLGFLL